MPELNGTIHIAVEPRRVYDFVGDWRNTTRYIDSFSRWEPVDPQHTEGVGARFRIGLKAGPVTVKGAMEVVEVEETERILFRSYEGLRLVGEWLFQPTSAGTRVELTNTFELPGGVTGRILGKVLASRGQRDLDESLARLKRLVEAA